MGLATNESDIQHVDELVKRADRALYEAKEEGRNRICWIRNGQFGSNADSTIRISRTGMPD
jgi:predicted signal transduction protein with EAL and GGDEF domain